MLPPLGYIPLDVSTLLDAIANEEQRGVSGEAGRCRATMSPRRSVTTKSCHHRPGSSKIRVAR